MRQIAAPPVPKRHTPLERLAEAIVLVAIGGLAVALVVAATLMAAA